MSVPDLVPDNLVLCGGSGADLEYGWLVPGEPDHYDVATVKSWLMISCTNSMMPSAVRVGVLKPPVQEHWAAA